MITIAQCRAARGLLGWTQQDLADAAGMSKTAINNFEKSHSDMKAESLKALRTAFEARDIEFLAGQGVKLREDRTEILKGHNSLPLLFDHIVESLKDNKGELLIVAPDYGGVWQENQKPLEQYLPRISKDRVRILCAEADISLWRKFGQCRRINARHESSMVSFCYADKTALALWQMEAIVIIASPEAAHTEAARFEYLWGAGHETGSSEGRSRA